MPLLDKADISDVVSRIKNWFRIRFIRTPKYMYQILTRGWCDSDTWSLDYTIAKFILPRLVRFKEINCSYPSNLTEKEWDNILAKMIVTFKIIASDGSWNISDEENEKVEEGLDLFRKYYFDLWD